MKLSDAEAARAASATCRAGNTIAELDPEDRATFDRWIEERRASNWMVNIFRDAGIVVADKTLRGHLTGRCSCSDQTANHRGSYRDATS